MKKEDYMKLSKERLAELLEERDNQALSLPIQMPSMPASEKVVPCYAPGGICTNKFHDCIGCPRKETTGFNITSTDINFTQ